QSDHPLSGTVDGDLLNAVIGDGDGPGIRVVLGHVTGVDVGGAAGTQGQRAQCRQAEQTAGGEGFGKTHRCPSRTQRGGYGSVGTVQTGTAQAGIGRVAVCSPGAGEGAGCSAARCRPARWARTESPPEGIGATSMGTP